MAQKLIVILLRKKFDVEKKRIELGKRAAISRPFF